MKNREQIRAGNALTAAKQLEKAKGKEGGDILSGFPALIVNNGLLATVAFSRAQSKQDKKSGHEMICDEIARHFADTDIALLPTEKEKTDMQVMLDSLTKSSSEQLRLCTAEALAYLGYLKRFV